MHVCVNNAITVSNLVDKLLLRRRASFINYIEIFWYKVPKQQPKSTLNNLPVLQANGNQAKIA